MNRGVYLQSSPVQQMMAGNPNNWWNTMRPPAPDHHHQPNFFSTTTPNSNFQTPYPHASSLPLPSWNENQDQLPESWSHLLMSGVVYEEEKASMLSQPPSNASVVDHVKQESSVNNYVYGNEEFHGTPNSTWSQIVSVPSSSSKSCATSFTSSSMLDFSNTKTDIRSPPSDLSSDQCNSSSAGGALKKARVQSSTTQSTFKVRKEKLGDRITALHQLVSPFGKTDTASVLLESIGYIRFLQSQIEALSLPYLGNGSGNMKKQQQQYVQGEKNCLFPEDPGQLKMAAPFEVKTRPFVFLKDINEKKDFWKIAVRVRDKWTVVKDGREHLEMVIVDAKGTDVQVIIPTAYKAEADKKIEENTTYTLSNFVVLTNDLFFKASVNKYKLIWTGGTTAVDPNVHDIPDSDLKFKPFAEIVAGKWRSDLLVHVIGYVHEIGHCQLNQGGSKKLQVNLVLKDLSDISLHCTLWEDYAAKFIKFNNDNKECGPVVVMLKYGKIKEEGKYPLCVSNTYGATKMYINADISQIKRFRESLPKNDQMMTQSQVMCTQSSAGSQFSTDDDLLSNPLIMPLSDILQLDEISYVVTVAKIDKVNSTKFGWYYMACYKCSKIAKGENPPYTCDAGHNTETEIVRYKLELDVSYGDTKATFVLWDRESTQLLGISAAQLRSNMIQAGITNRLEYPMLMDGIGGKNMAFKIKWQPKWKTISVVCYREGDVLATLVSSKFPEAVINESRAESADDAEKPPDSVALTEEVTMSVEPSATAEYDPDTLSQLTPMSDKSQGKVTNHASADKFTPLKMPETVVLPTTATYEEIIPAKQSSSKRVKVIKTEKK